MTCRLWFANEYSNAGEVFWDYIQKIPVVQRFFPPEEHYSIPKKNLSLPRRFLINDGSLWMVYYNTDIGFSPIEERSADILRGFLRGDINASKKVDTDTWEAALESMSIYIEYPISFSMEVFSQVMGIKPEKLPSEIKSVRDFVIVPSSDESDICLFVKDASESNTIYAYMLSNKYNFPASDLSVYTENDKDYYEPAFSTGLVLSKSSNVKLSPLVLFSDSQPDTDVLRADSLLDERSERIILESFYFNPDTSNKYKSADGARNFIENYASLTFYPDSVFEYKSVSDSRGISIDTGETAYGALNAAIDFAEQVWSKTTDEPFSMLVTSNLSDFSPSEPFTFRFNYYYNGRPIEILLDEQYGHKEMQCSVEITVSAGKIISYRQYMQTYHTTQSRALGSDFITALDYFVTNIGSEQKPETIKDIYIGYLNQGKSDTLSACWMAKTAESTKIYSYEPKIEEVNDELEQD